MRTDKFKRLDIKIELEFLPPDLALLKGLLLEASVIHKVKHAAEREGYYYGLVASITGNNLR